MLYCWQEKEVQHGRDQGSAMETVLHTRFSAVRKKGKPVGQRWFIREAKKIFEEQNEVRVGATNKKHYPCKLSHGWFERFCE